MADRPADHTSLPPPRTGIVLPFRRPPATARDADQNAAWDRLVALGREAWTWRDPESLEALERTVQELRGLVAREWSA